MAGAACGGGGGYLADTPCRLFLRHFAGTAGLFKPTMRAAGRYGAIIAVRHRTAARANISRSSIRMKSSA